MSQIARLTMIINMDIPDGLSGEQIAGSLYSLLRQKYSVSIDTVTKIYIGELGGERHADEI